MFILRSLVCLQHENKSKIRAEREHCGKYKMNEAHFQISKLELEKWKLREENFLRKILFSCPVRRIFSWKVEVSLSGKPP